MHYNALTTPILTRVWLQTTDRRMPLRAIWINTATPSTSNATSVIGGDIRCA